MRSRVEQFAAIRRDHRVDGLSIRALADKHGVHRRTVRQALESAVPPPRKTPAAGGASAGAVQDGDRFHVAQRSRNGRTLPK